jgi:hypothetical protein
VPHAAHHPFGGFRAFHKDHKIVGVAGKMMPAAFEFLIQRVEHDIRQQR